MADFGEIIKFQFVVIILNFQFTEGGHKSSVVFCECQYLIDICQHVLCFKIVAKTFHFIINELTVNYEN